MTNKLTQAIIAIWHNLVHFFEYGDLVPLMVLVSGVHYASVLAGKDQFAVAVAVGLLVDLGHFRTVRAAVRYSAPKSKASRSKRWLVRMASRFNSQLFVRWSMVLVMTAISLAYHQRYYDDWWLSVPLPLLIAFLAWQQRVDRGVGERKPVTQQTPVSVIATPELRKSETVSKEPTMKPFVCVHCLRSFGSQQALAGHIGKRHPVATRSNGRHKEEKVIA